MNSVAARARLSELKNGVDRLRYEAETAVSKIKCVITRGNALLKYYQESFQDLEHFLRSYPSATALMDELDITLVKLNCDIDITLNKNKAFSGTLPKFEINDSLLDGECLCKCVHVCSTCSKGKITVGTSTDVSKCALSSVGINTDLIALSQQTIGTNVDFSALSREMVSANTNYSAVNYEIVGSSTTDFRDLAHKPRSKRKRCSVDNICNIYNVHIGSILEMRYLQGDDPTQFWLTYYSECKLASHLADIKKNINIGNIKNVTTAPVAGQFFIGYIDTVFRGYVLSACNGKIMALDIDRGILKYVTLSDIWEIGDYLSKFAPQAVLCKLYHMPKNLPWCSCLSEIFKKCLNKSNLVVTVKAIIPGAIPAFVVDVDAHDDPFLDVNMSEWINSNVIPTVKDMKVFGLCDDAEKAFVQSLDPYNMYNEIDDTDFNSHSEQSGEMVLEDANIDNDVCVEPATMTIDGREVNSACVNVRGAQLNVERECIPQSFFCEKDPGGNSSFDNTEKHICQKQSDNLIFAELSELPIIKSANVLCSLEKSSVLEMSFLVGNNPWSFFLNYFPKQEIINVKRKIADRAQQGFLTPFPNLPKVGDFAVGKCGHDYFRVRIIAIHTEDNKNEVLCIDIDSRNCLSFNLRDIWVLEEEFSSPPAMAVLCSLWGIFPKDSCYWDDSLGNLFEAVLTRGRLQVQVTEVECSSGDWKHIVQILVHEDYLFDLSEWLMQHVFPSIERVRQFSASQDISEVISNLDPVKLFKKENNECAVVRFINIKPMEELESMACEPSADDSANSEIVLDDGSIDDDLVNEETIIQSLLKSNIKVLPCLGEEMSVTITSVVDMGTFYGMSCECQQKGSSQNTYEVLTELGTKIASAIECGVVKTPKKLCAGRIVIARYSEDEMWYRARLLSTVDENGYVKVYFVDYGNEDRVHKAYVKEMMKEFCELPFQAMRFTIEGIDVKKLNDPDGQANSLVLLNDAMERGDTYVRVIEITSQDVVVKLYSEGCDIGYEMFNLYHTTIKCLEKLKLK